MRIAELLVPRSINSVDDALSNNDSLFRLRVDRMVADRERWLDAIFNSRVVAPRVS